MNGIIVFAVLTVVTWWALSNQVALTAGGGHGDDLTKIEGVGPKLAKLLGEHGIHSFAELGKAKLADLEKIIDAGGSRFNTAEPDSWPKQAKLAAKGDWGALNKLQDELIGGK